MDDDIEHWLRQRNQHRPPTDLVELEDRVPEVNQHRQAQSRKRQRTQFSHTAKKYLMLWAMGMLSVQGIQGLAHANYLDGLKKDDLIQFASLDDWGTGGGHHTLREFRTRLTYHISV